MANTISTIPFRGTKEQEEKLVGVIEQYRDVPGALIPVLQQAQELYGYLPMEVQRLIAEKMGISLEKVYEVVSFYAQFTLMPKGEYKISVCLGTACYVKGSGAIYEKLAETLGVRDGSCTADGRFSLESCRCIGACGLAPVLTVNEDVYGKLTVDDVPKILAKYRD